MPPRNQRGSLLFDKHGEPPRQSWRVYWLYVLVLAVVLGLLGWMAWSPDDVLDALQGGDIHHAQQTGEYK